MKTERKRGRNIKRKQGEKEDIRKRWKKYYESDKDERIKGWYADRLPLVKIDNTSSNLDTDRPSTFRYKPQ